MRGENGGEYHYAGVTVPGGMPAIVPMEDVERVTRLLNDRHRPRRRAGTASFALTGKLFDGADGLPMTGTSGTSKSGVAHHCYRCRACDRTVAARTSRHGSLTPSARPWATRATARG